MLINESLILIVPIIKSPGHVRFAAFLPSLGFILLHCGEVSNQFKNNFTPWPTTPQALAHHTKYIFSSVCH